MINLESQNSKFIISIFFIKVCGFVFLFYYDFNMLFSNLYYSNITSSKICIDDCLVVNADDRSSHHSFIVINLCFYPVANTKNTDNAVFCLYHHWFSLYFHYAIFVSFSFSIRFLFYPTKSCCRNLGVLIARL